MPEVTPLDHLKGPQADEDQQKSQTDKNDKVFIPPLKILHLLGV
jgi:hypothetical protein